MQAEILKLPPETLDIITSFVDSPLDLGHLRAACKFFLALISPSHIQLRVIRAPLLSPVWQRLVEKPSLAQHVRVIEVQPEPTPRDVVDDPVIPAIFDDLVSPPSAKGEPIYEQALEAERVFVSALKAMVYLTSFKWSRMSPVIDPSLEDGVCTVLAKYLPRLENVDVLDCTNVPSWPTPGATSSKLQLHRWTDCLPVFLIKGMKEFTLGVYDFSFRPNALELDKLFIMLRASPGLARLKLSGSCSQQNLPGPQIIHGKHWPALRQLELKISTYIDSDLSEVLSSLFTLEVLILAVDVTPTTALLPPPPGVLPRLHQIVVYNDKGLVRSLLESLVPQPRPLETISDVVLDVPFLDALSMSRSGLTLKHLFGRLPSDYARVLRKLSVIAPNIETFESYDMFLYSYDKVAFAEFCRFPSLRSIKAVNIFSLNCKIAEIKERLRALVRLCPNIQELSCFGQRPYASIREDLVVIIERSTRYRSKRTWSVRTLRKGKAGPVDKSLGKMAQGSFTV